jgi:hypothetical protein
MAEVGYDVEDEIGVLKGLRVKEVSKVNKGSVIKKGSRLGASFELACVSNSGTRA